MGHGDECELGLSGYDEWKTRSPDDEYGGPNDQEPMGEPDQCPECGSTDPEDDVLDEVDIGVGTLYNRCQNEWHRRGTT